MKNFKYLTICCLLFCFTLFVVSCSGASPKSSNESVAEQVSLTQANIDEILFENSNSVNLEQDDRLFKINGIIDEMSLAQKNAFGVQDVTHVFVLKYIFDKERTISKFEISGDITKVYSVEKNVKNYVGSISDLFDNDDGEDAYTNLILSANTKKYTIVSTYSDGSNSQIEIYVDATLASS